MTELADKRRANGLMKTAREQALDLINEDEWAYREIAVRTYVFVEEGARLIHRSSRDYAPAESARVLARFLDRLAELTAVIEVD